MVKTGSLTSISSNYLVRPDAGGRWVSNNKMAAVGKSTRNFYAHVKQPIEYKYTGMTNHKPISRNRRENLLCV